MPASSSGVLPSLFSPGTSVSKNIEFCYIFHLVHCQLFAHLAVTHVLMERADDGGRVNIRDIVLYLAEPLNILAETLASLLGNDVQVARLPMGLVASSKGTNKLVAQI